MGRYRVRESDGITDILKFDNLEAQKSIIISFITNKLKISRECASTLLKLSKLGDKYAYFENKGIGIKGNTLYIVKKHYYIEKDKNI